MNKIYYNKERDVYQMFVPYPILPFSHIWNPKNEKVINKEHLKWFIEEGFLYNFQRSGPYFVSWNRNNNTYISDFVEIYSGTLYAYLLDKRNIHKKYCANFLQYFLDSTAVYTFFSHLICEENFSLLLEEQLKRVFGTVYVSQDDLEFFTFISSKEKLLSLEKELVPFEIEDEELFIKALDKSVVYLDKSKKGASALKMGEKLKTEFTGLGKYLV